MSEVEDHHWLHKEFESNLEYLSPCLKNKSGALQNGMGVLLSIFEAFPYNFP